MIPMSLSELGKPLIVIGLLAVLSGILLVSGLRVPFLGRLPGEPRIERECFSFRFPLMTCLFISAGCSLILWLFPHLR